MVNESVKLKLAVAYFNWQHITVILEPELNWIELNKVVLVQVTKVHFVELIAT